MSLLRHRALAALRVPLALALLLAGLAGLGRGPAPAGAAVHRVAGYRATVLGWSSWYGSYGLGAEGTAWCIDHGIRAPDPALRYVPTTLDGVPVATRTALAWAFGRHGSAPDRVTSAALMLVAHDLMGAQYPYGRLDVTALTERSIAGFGADGPAVLARARAIRADALAHSGLRPPWRLTIAAPPTPAGRRSTATVRVTAGGVGVAGIAVTAGASGATIAAPATATTGADGTARFTFTAGASGRLRLSASARVPDLEPRAYAPTVARAQRVVRSSTVDLQAALDLAPLPTTTAPTTSTTTTTSPTTTTSTSTSTTSTTTTSTSTTSSTTTALPPTTTTTAAAVPPASVPPSVPAPPPTTTSTTTTSTSTTTSTTTSAPPPPPPPAAPPALPRTGADVQALASTGAGLVLLGASLPRPRRRRAK